MEHDLAKAVNMKLILYFFEQLSGLKQEINFLTSTLGVKLFRNFRLSPLIHLFGKES
jgi:hypothetical protein